MAEGKRMSFEKTPGAAVQATAMLRMTVLMGAFVKEMRVLGDARPKYVCHTLHETQVIIRAGYS